jgi:transposase
MKYIEGFNRKQAILFPQCLDELIPPDAEVRIIDQFVDALPLKDLGFCQQVPVEEGRPMYHPSDLLKLYIYGYLNRIRTSRLLERECARNIELMWLLKGLRPCFRTIAGFRSEHPDAFRSTFRHFVGGLNRTGLLGRKTVAIDGTKFRAVNSKKNNYNQKKIDRHLAYIDQKINNYLQELHEGDLSATEEAAIRSKIKHHREHSRKYKRLETQLQQSGEEQISTTDPDARSMVIHGQVVEVAYNVQTIVDDRNNLVVEYEPTNINDRKALHGLALKAKAVFGKNRLTTLADKGYHNAQQLDSCAKDGIVTYVSPQDAPHGNAVPTPAYYGTQFKYNNQQDTYRCPAGQTLRTNGQWYLKKYHDKSSARVKHYRTPACKKCPMQSSCTTNPAGRIIERSEYAAATENNARRVRRSPQIYAARQQIIEHVFGTIKRQWGYDHILLKGLRKNDGEFGLIYLVYNLRRILNILGVEGVQKWVQKTLFSIFRMLALHGWCGQQNSDRTFSRYGIPCSAL